MWEVNPDSFKQKDPVIIHVLSDYLLITTTSKKSIITGKYRNVVDKVCPISDIGCIDMKDSPGTQIYY
jgi:hypothetical protein